MGGEGGERGRRRASSAFEFRRVTFNRALIEPTLLPTELALDHLRRAIG